MGKVKLSDVLVYEQPTKYIVKSDDYSDSFKTPVLTAGKTFILGYTKEDEGICNAQQNPVIIFDDFTSESKFVTFDFKVKSSAMKIIRTRKPEDSLKYFYYAMQSLEYTPDSHKRVWISEYSKLEVPYPNCDMQREIVNRLEKVEALIAAKTSEMNALDELVKSRFIEMFGDPVTNPKKFPEATLPELGYFARGVSKHRPRNAPELLGGKYPLIQTGDVANSGLYINGYSSTYSELGLKQSKLWKSGTLCITIAANIASTSILTFEACFPDSVVGFIANDKTNNVFIHYWFSFFRQIIDSQVSGAAQKNINLKTLSELSVISPPIDEQNRFARFVEHVDKSKLVIKKTIAELEELKSSLMQKYFFD